MFIYGNMKTAAPSLFLSPSLSLYGQGATCVYVNTEAVKSYDVSLIQMLNSAPETASLHHSGIVRGKSGMQMKISVSESFLSFHYSYWY